MVSSLKKMDKKFLIIIGTMLFLPLVIIIFLVVIQGCGNSKITYDKYEDKMITAAEKYIKDKDNEPKGEGEYLSISLSTLVEEGYIKSTSKLLDDSSCKGYVGVRRNGSSIELNNGGFINYIVNLECDNYSTISLADKLLENVVTEGSGLYADGQNYIYRGNKVDNNIVFFGQNYKIYGIDSQGIIKLVKVESELVDRIWDNKYNTEVNRNYGKNIYSDSAILDYLKEDYMNRKKISEDARKYIVAQDVCIGKRSKFDYSIDSVTDCSDKLSKQVISLLNISDYAKVSLDNECKDLNSRSCNNYNYLYGLVSSSWTLNVPKENTYEVLYLSDGLMESQNASVYNDYNIVIYIDGNQKYTSGIGSEKNPFVIE